MLEESHVHTSAFSLFFRFFFPSRTPVAIQPEKEKSQTKMQLKDKRGMLVMVVRRKRSDTERRKNIHKAEIFLLIFLPRHSEKYGEKTKPNNRNGRKG